MKKILSIITLILIVSGFVPQNVDAMTDTGYFVVTAYYSPLPNQKYYLTGDYEAEIRLNGEGIRGASGKNVFSGMLAGPKTYKFGTKIYLEGLGIGEISDRGGAIVTAGNRGYTNDRIDVWMGYGEEGLQRAMYWGKRTIKGDIVDLNTKITLNYNEIPAPTWTTSGLKPKSSVFTNPLGVGSNIDQVKKLQQFFKDINLYNGEINGIYNEEIISIIYNFQLEYEIVSSSNESGAGYWGNITRDKFKKAYLNGEFDKKIEDNNIITSNIVDEKSNKEYDIFEKSISGLENIKKLQDILKISGYYNGEITGNYEDISESIFNFQIEKDIVKNISDAGAGTFGPKTRAALKSSYELIIKEKEKSDKLAKEEENRRLELEKKYRELEKIAINKAEDKIKDLLGVKFGEVSPRVRDLQLTLKELGYFKEKDTAIYGNKTKDSIAEFQLENDLIDTIDSQYSGILGERTLSFIKDNLKTKYLKDELTLNTDINLDLLSSYLPNIKM